MSENTATQLKNGVLQWDGAVLSVLLLITALVLAVIALLPNEHVLKAIVLAWVVLP